MVGNHQNVVARIDVDQLLHVVAETFSQGPSEELKAEASPSQLLQLLFDSEPFCKYLIL